MSTKRGRIDGSFGAREVRHDKQIRIRDEVFDQLRRQITRGVQGDPVLLIHVEAGSDVVVLLLQRLAVFGIDLQGRVRWSV